MVTRIWNYSFWWPFSGNCGVRANFTFWLHSEYNGISSRCLLIKIRIKSGFFPYQQCFRSECLEISTENGVVPSGYSWAYGTLRNRAGQQGRLKLKIKNDRYRALRRHKMLLFHFATFGSQPLTLIILVQFYFFFPFCNKVAKLS